MPYRYLCMSVMNTSLETLVSLKNRPRRIVGLMSGTSLDGLDIALCEIEGENCQTRLTLVEFTTVPYSETFKASINQVFANAQAPLSEVTKLNATIARGHAQMVLNQLQAWNCDTQSIDLLASHGQTVFHAPQSITYNENCVSATLQLGDGDHLATLTGIATMSDFRQKHICAGGEGAPLVPYADFLLYANDEQDRILLNIGGIANFTYLPAAAPFSQIKCADTGPGNTLMDAYIQHHQLAVNGEKLNYDKDGALAKQGNINVELLNALLTKHNNLQTQSTGQEVYNLGFVDDAIANIGGKLAHTDVIATLNEFSASCISTCLEKLTTTVNPTVYVSGGGAHNQTLMNNIQKRLPTMQVSTSQQLGMPTDAKEAALFAVLANQSIFGDAQIFNGHPHMPAVSFGKLSFA